MTEQSNLNNDLMAHGNLALTLASTVQTWLKNEDLKSSDMKVLRLQGNFASVTLK